MTFCADVSRVVLALIEQDYDAYRCRESGRGEAMLKRASGYIKLEALLEKDLMWTEAGDADCVTQETALVTRSLVSAVSC